MSVTPSTSRVQGRKLPGAGVLARALVDMLLPPRCLACSAIIGGGAGLCGACWAQVSFITEPFCPRLGTPFPHDPGADAVSPAALADPPDFRRARAVARYEGPARELVHALKFRDRLETAEAMAVWMARAGRRLIEDCDIILPVPLHRRRLLARRFNQSALLAERIATRSGRRYAPFALQRIRPTRQQVGLSAGERRRNLTGAFRVDPAEVPQIVGRAVLVVDDVLTTGATANACARACLRAGAASVDVLAFARVVSPGTAAI